MLPPFILVEDHHHGHDQVRTPDLPHRPLWTHLPFRKPISALFHANQSRPQPLPPEEIKSYRTGVQENSDAGTEALGWEVVDEFGSDDTRVSVRPCDLAPDDSDLAALSLLVGSVDECDTLS